MKRSGLSASSRVAVVLALVFPVFALAATNANPALAFAPAPVVPVFLAGTGGLAAGTGAVLTSTIGPAVVGAAVAVAPLAVAAGAGLALGVGIHIAWKWANGGNTAGTLLDPPAAVTVYGGTWELTNEPNTNCGYSTNGGQISRRNCVTSLNRARNATTAVTYAMTAEKGPGASDWNSTSGHRWRSEARWTSQPDGGGIESGSGFTNWQGTAGQTTVISGTITQASPSGSYPYFNRILVQTCSNDFCWVQIAHYTPPGTLPAETVAASSGTTQVTTKPTSQCSNGSSVVGGSIVYTGATAPANLPAILPPACPAGTTRTGFTTPSTYPDGTTAPSPLAPWTAPVVPSAYPECNPASNCKLTLTQTAVDNQVALCNDTGICTGWASDATPETVTTSTDPKTQTQTMPDGTTRKVTPRTRPDGSTMKCTWGPYTLPAAQCETIPTEKPGTQPNTDNEGGCNWILSKPWTWPYTALVCAFVPTPGSLNATATDVKTAWAGTPPALVYDAVQGVVGPFTNLATPGPCEGPEVVVTMPLYGDLPSRPFSTCNALATLILSYALPIESFLVYAAALFGGARILTRTIGAESV